MRKALLTINNPAEAGLTLDGIDALMEGINPQYYCRCLEKGEKGTTHCHVAFYRPSPIRFSTIKRIFPTAHIDRAYGSMTENRDYVMKGGKWIDTPKADTSIPGTFAEFGTLPTEQEETAGKMAWLVEAIRSGKSTADIIIERPEFALRSQQIEILRETLRRGNIRSTFRNIDVSYIFGATGTGKTKFIYDSYDPGDVCRITSYSGDYVHFDNYKGQKVLVFDEFAHQVPLSDILCYLDGYPQNLPARYMDTAANYDTVYLLSNLPIEKQYVDEQLRCRERYKAFLRRINHIIEFCPDETQKILK